MKVRVKFAKEGAMKFIGHLDIMRYFQKAVKRAGLDAAFSEGFSPHMIMSFAAPLGVGITSTGEYFDMELNSVFSSAEMTRRFNEAMVDGMKVLSVRQVEEGKAGKAMSLVAAADYQVEFREGMEPITDWQTKLREFIAMPSVTIWKKTKKSEKEVDIRPCIYNMTEADGVIRMTLAAGSAANTKPELVMEAFCTFLGVPYEQYSFTVHRSEIYANIGTEEERNLVSLENLGEDIE